MNDVSLLILSGSIAFATGCLCLGFLIWNIYFDWKTNKDLPEL